MEDNILVCSGCLTKQPTVDRDMFDGLCADCTTKSLYDDDFEKRAKEINEQFKKQECKHEFIRTSDSFDLTTYCKKCGINYKKK
jgi:hypothetical protein